MNILKYFILVIISLSIYVFAPNYYDKSICIISFTIFIISIYSIIIDDYKRIGILNFNIIFFFSFFLCTYVFPIFLYGSNSVISELLSSFLGSYHTISRAVSLCSLAISVYCFSYVFFREKHGTIEITRKNKLFASKIKQEVQILLSFISIILIVVNWEYISVANGDPDLGGFEYLFATFYLILPLYFVSSALSFDVSPISKNKILQFLKKNTSILILEFLLIVVFLFLGNRGPIITIVLIIISTIMLFVQKISNKLLFSLGIIAVLMMFTLRTTRQMSNVSASDGIEAAASNANSVWDIFSDLVGINFELNAGMQYVDDHGNLYPGANLIRYIACPIPRLSSILIDAIYGVDVETVSTEQVMKIYTNHSAGNHCVIDLYMCFGIAGVVIVFFLFGMLVSKTSNGLNNNFFSKVFYICLMGFSLYYPRSSLMYAFRNFILLYFFILILRSITRTKKYSSKYILG